MYHQSEVYVCNQGTLLILFKIAQEAAFFMKFSALQKKSPKLCCRKCIAHEIAQFVKNVHQRFVDYNCNAKL